jgi:hypothetical protein
MMKGGEEPKKCISYVWKTRILTAFMRHAAYNMFSPPQNVAYFIMLSLVVHIMFILYIKVW